VNAGSEEQQPIASRLDTAENIFLALIMFVMVALVLAQVYVRFFMASSLTWSEELVRFLMIWMTFLGAVVALRRSLHIQIDNLVVSLSPKKKMVVLVIRAVMMVSFLGILAVGGVQFLEIAGLQNSPGLELNMSYVYFVLPLSSSLMAIITVLRLWQDIRQLKSDTKSQASEGSA